MLQKLLTAKIHKNNWNIIYHFFIVYPSRVFSKWFGEWMDRWMDIIFWIIVMTILEDNLLNWHGHNVTMQNIYLYIILQILRWNMSKFLTYSAYFHIHFLYIINVNYSGWPTRWISTTWAQFLFSIFMMQLLTNTFFTAIVRRTVVHFRWVHLQIYV